MRFEEVLPLVREDRRIARASWNEKAMWVGMRPSTRGSDMSVPYLYLRSPDGSLVPWAPSPTDLMADDWAVADIGVFVDGPCLCANCTRPADDSSQRDDLIDSLVYATKEAISKPMTPVWFAFDFGVEHHLAPFMFRTFFVAVDSAAPGLFATRYRAGLTRDLEGAILFNSFASCAAWCADHPGFHPEMIQVKA